MSLAFKEHCARDIDTCPEYDAPGGYMKPPPSFTRAAKPVQATDAVPVAVKSTGDRGTMASLHAANKSLRGEADDSEVTSSTIGIWNFIRSCSFSLLPTLILWNYVRSPVLMSVSYFLYLHQTSVLCVGLPVCMCDRFLS